MRLVEMAACSRLPTAASSGRRVVRWPPLKRSVAIFDNCFELPLCAKQELGLGAFCPAALWNGTARILSVQCFNIGAGGP